MCPNCDKVYDESEYSHCPYCYDDYDNEHINIVCDDDGTVLELTDAEYDEFKTTHKGYR